MFGKNGGTARIPLYIVLEIQNNGSVTFFTRARTTTDLVREYWSLDPGLDIHPLCSNSGQLKIMHRNTQSMVSTFN